NAVALDVIEKERRPFARCGAVNMMDDRAGRIKTLPAAQAGPPCEVQVLIIHVKALIKESDVHKHLAPVERTGPTRAKYLVPFFKLSVVWLPETAVATAPVAIQVETRAIQYARLMPKNDLGRYSSNTAVLFNRFHQAIK